jgi:hypothetical protein
LYPACEIGGSEDGVLWDKMPYVSYTSYLNMADRQ